MSGPWAPDLSVRQAFSNEMRAMSTAYNPERIRVAALAIYAVPKSAADLMRSWYTADDPAVRERVQTLYQLARERFGRHAKWFSAFAERGRVSELAGAYHLFITNPREILQEIDAFASSITDRP